MNDAAPTQTPRCIACDDSGVNSSGWPCIPCTANKANAKITAAKPTERTNGK